MEFLTNALAWWNANASTIAAIAVALFAASEALAAIPSVQSNSVYQFIKNVLGWLVKNIFKKAE